jgi:signal transduction histidine kinase
MFGTVLVVLLGVLAASFADALASRRQAEAIAAAAQTDRDTVEVLRHLRQERGTSREALRGALPPSAALLAGLSAMRERQAAAIGSLLRRCHAVDCGVRSKELVQAGDDVAILRTRIDAAFAASPWRPRPDLADAWQPVATRAVDLLAAMHAKLDRHIRRADAFVLRQAELASTAWDVRDVAGHERTVYAAAIRMRSLTPERRLELADYRGRLATGWARIEQATLEPDAPAQLLAAVHEARDAYFGDYVAQREELERALLAGDDPGPDAENRLQTTLNAALSRLAAIMDTGLDAIEAHTQLTAADARSRATQSALICIAALLFGLSGLVLLHFRVLVPIKTMTLSMQRFTDGRLEGPIPFAARRDEVGTFARALARFRSVTEEKMEIEAQLQHAQRLEALGTLSAGITHELNNALLPIIGLSERLARSIDELSPEARQVDSILQSALRARELVSRILIFARRTQGERRPLDLAAVVANSLELLRSTLPATVRIDERLEPVPPILGDEGQLGQVVVNLVTNAAHAIGADTGTIVVALAATPPPAGGRAASVCLSVTDTGCGMGEETRRRVFDPFFTTKPAGQGTGLGLSVVHGIVTGHGGRIVVESAPGKGTRFDVYLPVGADGKRQFKGTAA